MMPGGLVGHILTGWWLVCSVFSSRCDRAPVPGEPQLVPVTIDGVHFQ